MQNLEETRQSALFLHRSSPQVTSSEQWEHHRQQVCSLGFSLHKTIWI